MTLRWQRVVRGASTLLAVLSPFVLYYALSRGEALAAAAMLLGWVALRGLLLLASATRAQRLAMLPLPALGVVSALLNWLTRDARFLLLLPSLTQGSFALVFLWSLRSTPLVEHFARAQKPVLSAAEVVYCRSVTLVWGVVLSLATLVGVALAFVASLATWTAFVGVGSYVVVGVVFAVEYAVRRVRFPPRAGD